MNPLPVNMIKYLFKKGCKPTQKLFIYAVCQDQLSIMRNASDAATISTKPTNHKPIEWTIRFGSMAALDTCLLYQAEITDRAIMLSMRRPKMFVRLCEELM